MFEDENRDHPWLRTEIHSISYVFCQEHCLLSSGQIILFIFYEAKARIFFQLWVARLFIFCQDNGG
jgi:hypothetical protein